MLSSASPMLATAWIGQATSMHQSPGGVGRVVTNQSGGPVPMGRLMPPNQPTPTSLVPQQRGPTQYLPLSSSQAHMFAPQANSTLQPVTQYSPPAAISRVAPTQIGAQLLPGQPRPAVLQQAGFPGSPPPQIHATGQPPLAFPTSAPQHQVFSSQPSPPSKVQYIPQVPQYPQYSSSGYLQQYQQYQQPSNPLASGAPLAGSLHQFPNQVHASSGKAVYQPVANPPSPVQSQAVEHPLHALPALPTHIAGLAPQPRMQPSVMLQRPQQIMSSLLPSPGVRIQAEAQQPQAMPAPAVLPQSRPMGVVQQVPPQDPRMLAPVQGPPQGAQPEQYRVTKMRPVTEAPADYVPGQSAVDYIVAPAMPGAHGGRPAPVASVGAESASVVQQGPAASIRQAQVSNLQEKVDEVAVAPALTQQMAVSVQANVLDSPAVLDLPAPVEDASAFDPIQIGAKLPPAHIDLHGVCVNLQEFFEDRSGIIFGLVGAHHPVDSEQCVPRILNCMEHFEKLVDFVGCLVVNDPFVVKAWAKKLGVTDQFTFIADSDAKFTKVLGMAQNLPREGLGLRSRRFVAVIGPRARIRWVAFDEEASADHVLTQLPRFVRTPWKSFLASVGYSKAPRNSQDPVEIEAEQQVKNNTVSTLQNIRGLLQQQGFCADSDWQLLLCDKISDVYMPTKDNLLNGLKWLVEGAQAGDVLCFYFAGAGRTFTDVNGCQTVGLLPLDHETAGPIDQWEIFDVLAPHVPVNCRLTVILDVQSDSSAIMPLPYNYRVIPAGNQFETMIVSAHDLEEPRFAELQGEILVITLTGEGEVPFGSVSTLLTAVCTRPLDGAAAPSADIEGGAGTHESMATGLPPLSYAEQMHRMQASLMQLDHHMKNIGVSSSKPLDLAEEFSLADVLPVDRSEQ